MVIVEGGHGVSSSVVVVGAEGTVWVLVLAPRWSQTKDLKLLQVGYKKKEVQRMGGCVVGSYRQYMSL